MLKAIMYLNLKYYNSMYICCYTEFNPQVGETTPHEETATQGYKATKKRPFATTPKRKRQLTTAQTNKSTGDHNNARTSESSRNHLGYR